MEIVTHTCGQRLYRYETGGVRAIVIYGRLDDQREIHDCPTCGAYLSNSDLRDQREQPQTARHPAGTRPPVAPAR